MPTHPYVYCTYSKHLVKIDSVHSEVLVSNSAIKNNNIGRI